MDLQDRKEIKKLEDQIDKLLSKECYCCGSFMMEMLDAAKVRVKIVEKIPKKAFLLKTKTLHMPDEI